MNNFDVYSDEIIDIIKYNKDSLELILTDNDLNDIISSKKSYSFNLKYLSDAFEMIDKDDSTLFRKHINEYKWIINIKHKKTYLLHYCCSKGKLEFVSFLLFLGAKPNLIDDYGHMAQHKAIITDNSIIIDVMAVFGINMNVKDRSGNTPLHLAVSSSNIKITKLLINYKVNPTIKNNNNSSVIDMCKDQKIKNILKSYMDTYK